MNSSEFRIEIRKKLSEDKEQWPIVITWRTQNGQEDELEDVLHLSNDDWEKLTEEQEEAEKYGTILGKALFSQKVREKFIKAFSISDENNRLRILLLIKTAVEDKIRSLHWERLCAPIDRYESWSLLARNQRVSFSRFIPTCTNRNFPRIGHLDLHALVLVACPSNLDDYRLKDFSIEEAVSGIKKAFEQSKIPYEVLTTATVHKLSNILTSAEKPFTLLHIICHGRVQDKGEDKGETILYWTNENNQVETVTGSELVKELSNLGDRLPRFAFLCTCESGSPKAEAKLGGLAQRLVGELGMLAVVAMTRKVNVETALALGENFYPQLKQSGELDVALQKATAGLGDSDNITVPALFSSLNKCLLFSDPLDQQELNNEEIKYGINKLRELLDKQAPNALTLKKRFNDCANTLENTLGAESRETHKQRNEALSVLDDICLQVVDLTFNSLAGGKRPPEYKAECPFPGLSSFVEDKYHKFFSGREDLIKELKKKLEKDNFLAVIGPSGSGKSSVVVAGLIPQLNLQMVYLTPTNEPVAQLNNKIQEAGGRADSVFVVDQFEKVFTLCNDEIKQEKFMKILLSLADKYKVIITIRSDFWKECESYNQLIERIKKSNKFIEPMRHDELVTAMEKQANAADLKFEDNLSKLILAEVDKEPGAMSWLQNALRELWDRRRGRWLCSEEYEEYKKNGGVQKALSNKADEFYNNLQNNKKKQVRYIFLRLTKLINDDSQNKNELYTRKRVPLEDLRPKDSNEVEIKKLVSELADSQLVVTYTNKETKEEEVEVAHKALIETWIKLRNWLGKNQAKLQLLDKIEKEAEEWEEYKKSLHSEGINPTNSRSNSRKGCLYNIRKLVELDLANSISSYIANAISDTPKEREKLHQYLEKHYINNFYLINNRYSQYLKFEGEFLKNAYELKNDEMIDLKEKQKSYIDDCENFITYKEIFNLMITKNYLINQKMMNIAFCLILATSSASTLIQPSVNEWVSFPLRVIAFVILLKSIYSIFVNSNLRKKLIKDTEKELLKYKSKISSLEDFIKKYGYLNFR